MDEERLERIEKKLDQLLAVLDRFAPMLDKLGSGLGARVLNLKSPSARSPFGHRP